MGHSVHSVWPVAPWKVPATQLRHAPRPGVRPYVARLHGVGAELPAGHAKPAAHSSHSLSCVSIGRSPTVPSGQPCGAALAPMQYVPLGHGTGVTVAVAHEWPGQHAPEHCGEDCAARSYVSP